MREFFEGLGRGILAFLKYIWVPVTLFVVYLGLYLLARYGILTAFVESIAGLGDSIINGFDDMWNNWPIMIGFIEWCDYVSSNFFFALLGLIPFVAIVILMAVFGAILRFLWMLFGGILALIIAIITFVLSIVFYYILPVALAVFSIVSLALFVRRDSTDVMQTIMMILSSIICLILGIAYFFVCYPFFA